MLGGRYKKEHYVPRCYLKNFIGNNEKINVFDKYKMESRSQRIMEVAMENYFYDIKIDDAMQLIPQEKQAKAKEDIMTLFGVENWEDINIDKYVEKEFFAKLESVYDKVLESVIRKNANLNQWVIENCFCCSEIEKTLLSYFIAVQIIRTKTTRQTMGDTMEQLYQTLAYKMQMNDPDSLSKEEFAVSVDKEYVKLEHTNMILNEEIALHIAETLYDHIWVIYVNKTDTPFYTSDNPVANIPHKFHKYMSYAGLKSEGIEIVFPISPKLLLAMYDKKMWSRYAKDRSYVTILNKEDIEQYNQVQVTNSNRCVFCNIDEFDLVKNLCEKFPELQEYQSRVEVV